jgi:sugar lactone lactonase YvrE
MALLERTVELALDCHCDLGEGPIFDDRLSVLYFVDINRNTIHAFNTETNAHGTLELSEPVGAVALTTDKNLLLAATRRHILLVRFWKAVGEGSNREDSEQEPGVVRIIAETPESHGVDNMRFNDAKATPQGAFLAGRMHGNWRQPANRGMLYSLAPGSPSDLHVVLTPEQVGLPNGIAWSKDGRTCYFVDSAEETITAYATDSLGIPITPSNSSADSAPAPREISRNPTEHKHVPDGMTIDSNGKLWMVPGESGSVVQIDPETGEELQKIKLPVQRPTSCGFGGRDLEWLYVTTRVESGEGASEHHGGLFRLKIDGVKGLNFEGKYQL